VERAFAALHQETTDVKETNRRLVGEAQRLQAELASARHSGALLADTLASHSWRITAPLRWASSKVYPRP
jgi:hypothetical protein